MRAPLSWLREFVEIPANITAEQISDGLIRVGFEVEEIIEAGAGLTAEAGGILAGIIVLT
jgi:phenylalanyl-tRNA synthetase beta chain